jgi:hypothetical protein
MARKGADGRRSRRPGRCEALGRIEDGHRVCQKCKEFKDSAGEEARSRILASEEWHPQHKQRIEALKAKYNSFDAATGMRTLAMVLNTVGISLDGSRSWDGNRPRPTTVNIEHSNKTTGSANCFAKVGIFFSPSLHIVGIVYQSITSVCVIESCSRSLH